MTRQGDDSLVRAIEPLERVAGATQEEDTRHLVARQALIRLLVNDVGQWHRFCEFMEVNASDNKQALRAGMYYVENKLKLDAPWLAYYLSNIYVHEDRLRAMTEAERHDLWVSGWEEYDPPAPSLPSLPEDWAKGLTSKQARTRLQDMLGRLDAATAKAKPRGWLRGDLHAITSERVGWWYRQKILGQSVKSIANEAGRGRPDIRNGIGQAQRWLFENAVWHFTKFKQE